MQQPSPLAKSCSQGCSDTSVELLLHLNVGTVTRSRVAPATAQARIQRQVASQQSPVPAQVDPLHGDLQAVRRPECSSRTLGSDEAGGASHGFANWHLALVWHLLHLAVGPMIPWHTTRVAGLRRLGGLALMGMPSCKFQG